MPDRDALDQIAVPDDPAAVYPELVARNPRVCKQCGRRLRRREALDGVDQAQLDGLVDILAFVDYDLPEGSRWDLIDREYHESVELEDRLDRAHPPSDDPSAGGTRTCEHCGAVDPHRSPATRSREEAVDFATGVSVTLEEFGVAHDWLRLLAAVDRLKTVPATAGDDHECLRRATAYAIEAVDPR